MTASGGADPQRDFNSVPARSQIALWVSSTEPVRRCLPAILDAGQLRRRRFNSAMTPEWTRLRRTGWPRLGSRPRTQSDCGVFTAGRSMTVMTTFDRSWCP